MQNAPSCRPARLAIATIPTLDHFVLNLARELPVSGTLDVKVFPIRCPADLDTALAWTDRPGDAVWFEFCWPPFPAMINNTEFGHRRIMVRVHRIEAYEADFVALTNWSRVDDLIVVSSDMARVVREVAPGIDHQTRLHVIHNGVDMTPVVPRKDFDKHRIGWCGAFILRKNPSFALQVLYELHLHDIDYMLHIAATAGDRVTMESFRHQADMLGLCGAVHFDGKVSAAEMPAWHARNGVLLSTSLHESFGYAIAEAAAAGCDIAVLEHRGADEFWPAETRFLTAGDAARKIRESRPSRWNQLIADRFSLERQVAALRRILDAKPAGPTALEAGRSWSATYWDARYRRGGTSGAGSIGRLATFKAETVNRIVAEHGISSVIEFGCGDGRQLALADYPSYVGVDVSPEAIRLCSERFLDHPSKTFLTSEQDPGEADLVLSLDVIFHLVEDDVFHRYMTQIFSRARSIVTIYSSNYDMATPDAHVRHRNFSAWVARHAEDWHCVEHVPNPYPFDPHALDETSFADFYVFGKTAVMEPA